MLVLWVLSHSLTATIFLVVASLPLRPGTRTSLPLVTLIARWSEVLSPLGTLAITSVTPLFLARYYATLIELYVHEWIFSNDNLSNQYNNH